MTNHIHLIIAVKEEYSLSQTISDFKKYTTYEILRLLKEDNRKYLLWILENSFEKKKRSTLQLWQQNNYPEVIETEKFYKEKQEYIYNNPVKKGYVEKPESWQYSSATNRLFDDHNLIKV